MSNPERWLKFAQLPADILAKLERLPAIFEQHGSELAYLFGSLARGEVGKDVDLAILTQAEPAFRLRAEIIECLETERLDLVDLRRAAPSLCFEVISTGRLIQFIDQVTVERFEMHVLHQYRDTAHLRRQQNEYLRMRETNL
jgi:predicted nucleotidyltransferase